MSKKKLVEMALAEVGNNSLYLWGGQGEVVLKTTPEKLLKMETNKYNVVRILRTLANKINGSKDMSKAKYFDCSGLVVYILQKLKYIGEKDDYTADMIYKQLCTPVLKKNLVPGDLVFKMSDKKCKHVGIFVGDNLVVESAGRDTGVVCKMMASNNWNAFGRLKKLD